MIRASKTPRSQSSTLINSIKLPIKTTALQRHRLSLRILTLAPQRLSLHREGIKECQRKSELRYWNHPQAGDVKIDCQKDIIETFYDESKDLLGRLNIMKANSDFDETTELADVVDAVAL